MSKIIHGNCFALIRDIVRGCDNPIIVTDPPFNVGYGYDEYRDKKPEDEYYGDLSEMFSLCPSVVIHYPEPLYRISYKMGVMPERVVSWIYNSNTPRQHRDICFFGINPCFDGLGEYKNPTDKRVASLIEKGRKPIGYDWIYQDQVKSVSKGKDSHPCEMPLEVMLYIVNTLPKNATVIEPFMGSGTTCVAAKRTGREFVGIEMSSRYFIQARNRIENDTPLFDTRTLEVRDEQGE